MAVSSFLAEGAAIPQGSAVTDLTKQAVLPEWYTNYAMDILSGEQALANRPYTTAPMPRVAGFTPGQQQGFGMTGTAATAYQPGLTAATDVTKAAIATPGSLPTAQPFINAAGQSTVANIGTYMNPFTDQVVSRIGELGQRNLTENLLPAIEGRYIQAGQLGYGSRGGAGTSSGMLTDTARAIRDTNADILGKQAEALQSGYTQAAGLSAADLSRMGALAGTVGNLQGSDITRALSGAEQLGGLAASEQTLGLKGAEAVTGVGAQQQALNQKNLDVAREEFLRQQGYPQEQINNMLAAFKGVATGVPQAETTQGLSPSSVTQQYPASTAAQIGTGLTAAAGALSKLKEVGLI
jgi:hypothetical protein